MKCYHCDTENLEGAQFCKKCGRRLDGMSLCTACGKMTPADGEYCIYCGSNRNAPVYSMPLRFPLPETPQGKSAAVPAAAGFPVRTAEKPKARKEKAPEYTAPPAEGNSFLPTRAAEIVGKISEIAALVTAALSLIFTFLIGASPKVEAGGASTGTTGGFSIFYFFGDAFQTAYTEKNSKLIAQTGAFFGTGCVVFGLLLVVLSVVFLARRIVLIVQKKTDKGILAPAAMTYLAYLFTVALFLLCIGQKAEVAGVSTSVAANVGTVAGIVLGAVALAAAFILSVLKQGMTGEMRDYLIRTCSSVLYAILAFVAIGLLGSGAVFMTTEALGIKTSTVQGFHPLFTQIASEYVASGSSETYAALYNITAALSAVLVVAAAAACVTGSRALSDLISSPGGKLQKRTLAFAIAAGLCLAAAGVMMAVVSLVYVGKMGNEALSAALGVPIGLAVIGVLMCVLAIVRKKFSLPEEEPADVVPALS